MKVSGKGIAVIITFLVLIPFLIDIFFAIAFPDIKVFDFAMTKFLVAGYIKVVPSYIGYLIVAFTVLYLIKTKWKKSISVEQLQNSESESTSE